MDVMDVMDVMDAMDAMDAMEVLHLTCKKPFWIAGTNSGGMLFPEVEWREASRNACLSSSCFFSQTPNKRVIKPARPLMNSLRSGPVSPLMPRPASSSGTGSM